MNFLKKLIGKKVTVFCFLVMFVFCLALVWMVFVAFPLGFALLEKTSPSQEAKWLREANAHRALLEATAYSGFQF